MLRAVLISVMSSFLLTAAAAPSIAVGPPPDTATLWTLGIGVVIAFIVSYARLVRTGKDVKTSVLLAESVIGSIAGLVLTLAVAELKPGLSWNSVMVLSALGGAFGFAVFEALAQIFGGRVGLKLEMKDTGGGDESTDKKPNDGKQKGGKGR